MAEGEGVRQYPRGVPRERPVSAHRGTGGKVLRLEGASAQYIYMRGTGHVTHERA